MTGHNNQPNIAVLMGPTASGKTALALAIAAKQPTVIINADAMQMVDGLRVITARPTVEEEAQAEHALYGVLQPEEPTSVAAWLKRVQPVIAGAIAQGKLPLLVGGTGMYIKALMDGLAEVPPIAKAVREKYRALPPEALYPALLARDAAMAARLKPGDTQRLIRALEVIEGTGHSLAHWQAQTAAPLFAHAQYRVFATDMPRAQVYARIDRRFEGMMEAGALDEVAALFAAHQQAFEGLPTREAVLALPPIFRAHGVPELIAYLRGEMTREDAIRLGQQHTRNYAKRQMTWLRNQLPHAAPPDFTQL